MATYVINATFTPSVTYSARIKPPIEVRVFTSPNGSYVVNWQDGDLPKSIGNYTYEVLVSEGTALNYQKARKFEVAAPPFVFDNSTNNTYTFAVRIKTHLGYRSSSSPDTSVSKPVAWTGGSNYGGFNLSAILIPVCLLIVVLLVALGALYIRHRRLQNSFTRFTNSHYNPRSEAATFEDNGLEEEETSPQIRGFSDDEPLVIA